MTHHEFITATTRRMRDVGPAVVLDELRAAAGPDHHDTLTVFYVWAIDRLLAAGLTDVGVLWHPLTDARSPWAWYDAATLASDDARRGFVPATLAGEGDPVPAEPRLLIAA